MPSVIDADTHVIESEAIWEFFDPEMAARKPTLVRTRNNGHVTNRWLIDGNLVPKPEGRGGQRLATPPIGEERQATKDWQTRALGDLESRLEDATRMGVETQVIYPTLFIGWITHDPVLEVAIYRSYNRFMADVYARGHGRLRYVVLPPLRNIEESIKEMRFGKEHGAVGVMFRGLEGDLSVAEPYFYPIYEEAQRLDLPICIHTGPGSPTLTGMVDNSIAGNLTSVRLLPVMAFHDLVTNKIPEKYPDLRIGFIETNSSWVPFMAHFLNRRFKNGRMAWGPQFWKENRLYVACEADEDLPYILQYTGEDNMISGSDYGHGDPSAEPELVHTLRAREDVEPAVIEKILCDNPKRFYAL